MTDSSYSPPQSLSGSIKPSGIKAHSAGAGVLGRRYSCGQRCHACPTHSAVYAEVDVRCKGGPGSPGSPATRGNCSGGCLGPALAHYALEQTLSVTIKSRSLLQASGSQPPVLRRHRCRQRRGGLAKPGAAACGSHWRRLCRPCRLLAPSGGCAGQWQAHAAAAV